MYSPDATIDTLIKIAEFEIWDFYNIYDTYNANTFDLLISSGDIGLLETETGLATGVHTRFSWSLIYFLLISLGGSKFHHHCSGNARLRGQISFSVLAS